MTVIYPHNTEMNELTGSIAGLGQVAPQWIVKKRPGHPDEVEGRSFKSYEMTYHPHDRCRERNDLKVSFGQTVKMEVCGD